MRMTLQCFSDILMAPEPKILDFLEKKLQTSQRFIWGPPLGGRILVIFRFCIDTITSQSSTVNQKHKAEMAVVERTRFLSRQDAYVTFSDATFQIQIGRLCYISDATFESSSSISIKWDAYLTFLTPLSIKWDAYVTFLTFIIFDNYAIRRENSHYFGDIVETFMKQEH